VDVFQETVHRVNRVFLEDLHVSLDCQEWLDVQCLDQVTTVNAVLNGNPYQNYRVSACHMGSHKSYLPPTQANAPRLNPSRRRL